MSDETEKCTPRAFSESALVPRLPGNKVCHAFDLRSAFRSETGPVRATNQDAWLNAADIGIWVVADGMGGHEGGEIAARAVIDALDCVPDLSSAAALFADIERRLVAANDRLRAIAYERFGGRVVGATVVVLAIHGVHQAVLWAGDSRAYRLRDDRLLRLTNDHAALRKLPENAEPRDNRTSRIAHLRNTVTRAVGGHERLAVDVQEGEGRRGDTYLLCSDGLTKVLSDDEIHQILRNSGACQEMVDRLVNLALERYASDNITAGVIQVR